MHCSEGTITIHTSLPHTRAYNVRSIHKETGACESETFTNKVTLEDFIIPSEP